MSMKLQKWRSVTISLSNLRRVGSLSHCRPINNGPDTIEELFERHVAKKDANRSLDDEEDEFFSRRRLTSQRREALSLYRDIIRASRFFVWPDARGRLWRDVLRENARKEFEDARFEKDPEVVTKLLIGGREAVESAIDKLIEKQRQQIERERAGGGGIGGGGGGGGSG